MQYHERTGTVSFVCGTMLEGHWRILERLVDSGKNPVEPLLWGWFGWTRNRLRWLVLHDQPENQRANMSLSFVGMGVCGHTIGKLTHPQTKAGPSIDKNRPIPRLCIIKHETKLAKLRYLLFSLQENHPFPGRISEVVTVQGFYVLLWPIHRFLGRNLHPSADFGLKN